LAMARDMLFRYSVERKNVISIVANNVIEQFGTV